MEQISGYLQKENCCKNVIDEKCKIKKSHIKYGRIWKLIDGSVA